LIMGTYLKSHQSCHQILKYSGWWGWPPSCSPLLGLRPSVGKIFAYIFMRQWLLATYFSLQWAAASRIYTEHITVIGQNYFRFERNNAIEMDWEPCICIE
jgi:hypothetical protein